VSERMVTKKLWDYVMDYVMEIKKGSVLKKGKVYLLSREERGKVYEFIKEQLRKSILDSQSHFK